MLTVHFIRILVEMVRWQKRSSFKTAIVHNALGNFRGYVGLVRWNGGERSLLAGTAGDDTRLSFQCDFPISALKPAALNHLIASYSTIIELLNPHFFHKYLQAIPDPFCSYSAKSSRR